MNNIKKAREAKGLSQKAVALSLKVSAPTVSEWESGKKKPNSDNLIALSKLLDIDTDYLLDNEPPTHTRKKGVKIPVYGRVAAGVPIEAIEEIIDYEEIDEEMAKRGEYIALQVHGSSMEPRFTEGDVVIVRLQPDVESGEIAIIFVNGSESTMKRLVKRSSGIQLISTNPAFDPMYYTNEEVLSLPITVLGKVVELRAKF